jgi:hypothetical protein
MGHSRHHKNKYVTTVHSTVVQLSYIQTLAIANNLMDVTDLETEAKEGETKTTKEGTLDLSLLPPGFDNTSKVRKMTRDTEGVNVVDQWFHPYYDKIRYAIGIRELTVASFTFAEQSELISKPFISPKEIIKVHIVVDEYIPSIFDRNQVWIKYYIKPEGEQKWIQVNPFNSPTRFDDEGNIVPKIINFNLPKPTTTAIEDKYQDTKDAIKKMRFRAVLSRPLGGNNESITPLLKSYRMIFTPRT